MRERIIKKISFEKLPKEIQDSIKKASEIKLDLNLKRLKEIVNKHKNELNSINEEIEKSSKQLLCKHEHVTHEINGCITDNVVSCDDCGLGWSDY